MAKRGKPEQVKLNIRMFVLTSNGYTSGVGKHYLNFSDKNMLFVSILAGEILMSRQFFSWKHWRQYHGSPY